MNTLTLAIILFLTGAPPLALGSVHEATSAFLEAGTFLLLLIVLHRQNGAGARRQRRRTLYLMLPLLALLILMAVQLLPLPPAVLEVLSPQAAERLRVLFGPDPGWHPLSLAPYRTLQQLRLWAAYGAIFYVAATLRLPPPGLRTGSDVSWTRVVIMAIAAIGMAEALYGLWQFFGHSGEILLWRKNNAGPATGTYVNRNHFAGYLNMALFVTLGLWVAQWPELLARRKHPSALRDHLFRLNERRTIILSFLFPSAVALTLGILFSLSRTGVFSLLAGFSIMVLLLTWGRLPRVVKPVLFAGLAGLAWGWFRGLDPLITRFLHLPEETARPLIWKGCLVLAAQFPFLGSGAGSFRWIFPPIQGNHFGSAVLTHAHQDYLELLVDTGAVGLILFVSFWALFFRLTLRKWSARRHPGVRAVVAGCLAAVATLLIHGFADFNWHIPANAFTAFLIGGICFNLVHAEHGRARGITSRKGDNGVPSPR